jgi:hypothetical protein
MKDITAIEKLLIEACDNFVASGEGKKIVADIFLTNDNSCRCPLASVANGCFDETLILETAAEILKCSMCELESFMRGFDGLPVNARDNNELQFFDLGTKLRKKYIFPELI